MIEQPFENDSQPKSFFSRKLNHPYKRSLFRISVGKDILFIIILIIYNINPEIFGNFGDMIFMFTTFGLVLGILSEVAFFFVNDKLQKFNFPTPHHSKRSLEREFKVTYKKYVQIIPALPKMKVRFIKKLIYSLGSIAIIGMIIGFPDFLYETKNNTDPTQGGMIFIGSCVVFLLIFGWYLNALEKDGKYKIPRQKKIQRNFLNYYTQLGLVFSLHTSQGIEIITSPTNLEQTDAVHFIKNGQGILYFEQFRLYFLIPFSHLLLAIPTLIALGLQSDDRNVYWTGVILGGLLIGVFIWIIYKMAHGALLEKKTYIALGIYIKTYKDRMASRTGGEDDFMY